MTSTCAVIPTYNHHRVLPEVVARLREVGLPVILVDDGSAAPTRDLVAALHDPERGVRALRLPVNRGKGGAVIAGLRLASAAGFTHALQVDADGQHDLSALPELLARSAEAPGALISGQPRYDDTVPLGRRLGRWITHGWVYVETLSLQVRDTMCGFRVYPLHAVIPLLDAQRVGERMDFDIEIIVRLVWQGVPTVFVPVGVTYPEGNTSNFDGWRDNLRISWMHTRLFLGMIPRIPSILRNRWRRPAPTSAAPAGSHWASMGERGAWVGLWIAMAAWRLLGRVGCMMILSPAVLWFFLSGHAQRRASLDYLQRAFLAADRQDRPTWRHGLRHFFDFTARAIEAVAVWSQGGTRDDLILEDPDAIAELDSSPRGAILVVSHYGNHEVVRAKLGDTLRRRLTVLIHTRHAENYNRLLRSINPEAALRMVEVTRLDAATAASLLERVERGEWLAIAADRVPPEGQDRVVRVPFLGADAALPQGPWILASLLGVPVWSLSCQRRGGTWRVRMRLFADRVVLPRGSRVEAITTYAARYARELEQDCLEDPYQWYNFYDFWAKPRDVP